MAIYRNKHKKVLAREFLEIKGKIIRKKLDNFNWLKIIKFILESLMSENYLEFAFTHVYQVSYKSDDK